MEYICCFISYVFFVLNYLSLAAVLMEDPVEENNFGWIMKKIETIFVSWWT